VSRRGFLKGSSASLAATTLAQVAQAKTTPHLRALNEALPEAAVPASGEKNPVDFVNLLQGTASTAEFSTGNTLPIAALPFGMAHWTLQSQQDGPWFFQPWLRRIQGVRCTHQLSPWLGDYGHATFLPVRGKPQAAAASRASSYRPEDARLTPYSLQLFLLRYRAHIELVPTERGCILSANFEDLAKEPEAPATAKEISGLIVDIPKAAGEVKLDAAARRLRFACSAASGGTPPGFATYYVVQFSRAWNNCEIEHDGERTLASVSFDGTDPFEARIATSFISFDQADFNFASELSDKPLAALRDDAKKRWNEHLGRIEIAGATAEQERTFYSCFYRALLFPRIFSEPNPAGGVHHFSAFNGKIEPGVMYADHGYWDVYRAWYPFMSVLFPERLGEILQAWVNAYKEGGWMPQFPAPGYRACMTGSLIDSVFGDAAVKGIEGFDLATAYEGLRKHATTPGDPTRGYGRVGVELYIKFGYVPADLIPQSAAETVDAAYGDFCIAQIARSLGKSDDAQHFTARSGNWKNLFDSQTHFIRGKNADGTWLTPFDPFTWGSPYVEGSAWQHRWDAPHDIPGMIAAMGGPSAAAAALERMLAVSPRFNVGVYRQEIHEMSEMAAVPFGQYAQSNQPSHHLLYLFAHAGRPDRAQFWVRRVMQDLYTSNSFPGDEDTGSMAAWYVLSSLGFYSTCPGKAEYTLGSPLFRRATLHLENGKTLIIQADENTPETPFVSAVSLNGRPTSGPAILHEEIKSGGTLRFVMSASAG
jgi:predicted alpha-1,2-mannosidase